MSYSFSVYARSVAAALAAATTQFDKMVEGQPNHKHDREPALANAKGMTSCLGEPKEGEIVLIQMSGSLGWQTLDGGELRHTSANGSCSAYFTDPKHVPTGVQIAE